jgi:hypothetical protein
MDRVFKINPPFPVPDGTLVSPFLNSKDNQSGLPFDLLDGFSLAAGIIEAGTHSKIHIMPFVTQVTFVKRGKLKVKMKSGADVAPYEVSPLEVNQAVITRPGTLFQLINDGSELCETLYIVSPAYLFEMSGDRVIYDDSVVLEEDWQQLAAANWQLPKRLPSLTEREETERRLAARSR